MSQLTTVAIKNDQGRNPAVLEGATVGFDDGCVPQGAVANSDVHEGDQEVLLHPGGDAGVPGEACGHFPGVGAPIGAEYEEDAAVGERGFDHGLIHAAFVGDRTFEDQVWGPGVRRSGTGRAQQAGENGDAGRERMAGMRIHNGAGG